MIFDKIENLKKYEGLHPRFAKAMNYLLVTDFSKLEDGKHTVDGDDIFAILQQYETKNAADCMLEGHRKYIDIQFVLTGEENMGMVSFNDQPVLKPYVDENDIAFFDGEYSTVKIPKDNFTIFFPGDLHMPSLDVNKKATVRKVVMKIRA